jgi:hypothetical protein
MNGMRWASELKIFTQSEWWVCYHVYHVWKMASLLSLSLSFILIDEVTILDEVVYLQYSTAHRTALVMVITWPCCV